LHTVTKITASRCLEEMKKKCTIMLLLILFWVGANAQVKVIYKETKDDFPNPERGFYRPSEARARNYIALQAGQLKTFRSPQLSRDSSFSFSTTLIYRGFLLDSFLNGPISALYLEKVQNDFNAIRMAGIKAIVRFAYTNRSHTGDCPDEYKICPPYGDAPRNIVLAHIEQLKPILRANADVIAVLQMGFIGIWGENYFTDYFGDASTNGKARIMDSSWRDRNEVLQALLEALPKDRMVQVRTPQLKQRFVYGPSGPVSSPPLKKKDAYTGSDEARIGFHNDCFLANIDDYGTFYDYGNSASPRGAANEVLRRYFIEDSRYVAVGGETCDNTFSPQNDCEPAGHAEKEMRSMHYSYLNVSYNMQVIKDWVKGGCIDNIKSSLGYRFVLHEASFPVKVKKGKRFNVNVDIENSGYASPFNPRRLWLVLRNQVTGKEYFLLSQVDIRFWVSGKIKWVEKMKVPASLPAGKYQLLLNLPDNYASISKRPEYSIRLANENLWEPNTGYNRLGHSISVE